MIVILIPEFWTVVLALQITNQIGNHVIDNIIILMRLYRMYVSIKGLHIIFKANMKRTNLPMT